jgi:hypothetical protein
MALAEPTPSGTPRRIYRNAVAETSTATGRVKLALPAGVEVLRIVGVNVVASGGTMRVANTRYSPTRSGGTRLWLGRWGSVTPGLLGDWSGGDVQVAPLPAAGGVWFAPHPDQSDGSIVYTVTLEIVQSRVNS